MKNFKKEIELLKLKGINYSIESNRLTINGYLDLGSLTSVDKDFLKNTTINGWLDLRSLTSVDKDFLKNTTINGYLYLNSLTSVDKDLIRSNVSQLQRGYNKELSYCYFDGILSKVILVTSKKGYTIYTTPFGFIAEKGKFTSHGVTVKKSIQDLEFKIISEKLKNEPITEDTLLTVKYYRLITGSCEQGCKDWMQANDIPFKIINKELVEVNPIKAKDLLPLLIKSNAYGLEKIKSLITF